MTRRRKILFATITVGLALGLALVVGELILRAQSAYIRQSDRMDPGLIAYDADVGWRLVERWRGRHRHHDFDVEYVIGPSGFRETVPPKNAGAGTVAFLGDSFTFGLGVSQGETFVDRFAELDPQGRRALSFGVPGTSTDQQLMILEDDVLPERPQIVVLVVCLINDLFDNRRSMPLQAPYPKPYYELEDGELRLRGVPVPKGRKPDAAMQADLDLLVVRGNAEGTSGLVGFLGRREIFKRLGLFQPKDEVPEGYFEGRYEEELALFAALAGRMRREAEDAGAELVVALLAGRSFVEHPESWSAAFQDHFRRELLAWGEREQIPVVDVATALRERTEAGEGHWFHPHEGHTNPAGHRAIAEALLTAPALGPGR